MFVLDSNIAIAALNGGERVLGRLAGVPADEVGLPAVVVAELLYGAYRSGRRESNLKRVLAMRQRMHTLRLTDEIVDLYASTRADLRRRDINKSDFDLLIATTARAVAAPLVTDDGALLDGSIPGLQVENWLAA